MSKREDLSSCQPDNPALALVTGHDPEADGFWKSVSQGKITIRHCPNCSTEFVIPIPGCPECGTVPDLHVSSGIGILYTWVVARYAFWNKYEEEVPYIVGSLEFGESCRIFARIEGISIEKLAAGQKYIATFPTESGRPPIVFVPLESISHD